MRTQIIAAHLCLAALTVTNTSVAQFGTSNVDGMEMRIGFNKTELTVGEPLFIEIRVTNRTCAYGVSNFESRLFLAEGADIDIRIQRPGELPERYSGIHKPGVYPSERLNLKQEEYTDYERTILYDARRSDGYAFNRPGEYLVTARLGHIILAEPVRTYTQTPPVRITVRAPEGRAAEAFKLIDDPECAKAIHSQETTDPAAAERIRKVATEYPDTPYGPLCLFFCGWYDMHRQNADYAEAAREFRDFLSRYPGHPKESAAIFQIAMCYHHLHRPEVVMAWLLHLKDYDPGFSLFRSENRLVNYYYFDKLEPLSARRWWLYGKPWDVPAAPARTE